jgi:hypothetical protein
MKNSFPGMSVPERRITMIRHLIRKPAVLAAALLLSCGMLFGTARAQDFENEGYSGLYEEDNYEDGWYYDAYEAARDDDLFEDNQWYNEEPRYRGLYNEEPGEDDWFYDAYEEREASDWWDWDLF